MASVMQYSAAAKTISTLLKMPAVDTAYVRDFRKQYLVLRLYESTMYNDFDFSNKQSKATYRPNEHNNLGIGFTYRFLSINIGNHVGIADRDYNQYGKTRQFDLQSHFYYNGFIIDFYGQYYKGYYLDRPVTTNNIVKRPDINTTDLSLSVQYVVNNARYSYLAPFYQNQLQKKSAGSWLVGGGFYNSAVRGDSAIIGRNLQDTTLLRYSLFTRSGVSGLGVNLGYAYTQIIHTRFFVGGSFSLGLGLNAAKMEYDDERVKRALGPQYNVTIKLAGGYHFGSVYAGVNYIRLSTWSTTPLNNLTQQTNRGNYRFVVARRFRLRKNALRMR
jgi:hypothetical protein